VLEEGDGKLGPVVELPEQVGERSENKAPK
jgi:hypothetical protein